MPCACPQRLFRRTLCIETGTGWNTRQEGQSKKWQARTKLLGRKEPSINPVGLPGWIAREPSRKS